MFKTEAVQKISSICTEEIVEESKFQLEFTDFEKDYKIPKKTFVSEKVKLLFIDAEWWITVRLHPNYIRDLFFKVHISRSAGQVQLENCKFNFAVTIKGLNTASVWYGMSNDKVEYETSEMQHDPIIPAKDISIKIVLSIKRFDNPSISSKFSNSMEGYHNIIKTFSSLMNDSTFADFKFVVRGKEFKVHKNILAASSPVFASLFTSDMQEAHENVCVVDKMESEIFNSLLRFIYQAKLPTNFSKIALEIYEAADYYDLKRLKDICAKEIQSQLSKDNAVQLYCWAYAYESLNELKKDSWTVVKRDILRIYFSMKGEPLPPEDLKKFLELKHRYQQSLENFKENSEPEEKK